MTNSFLFIMVITWSAVYLSLVMSTEDTSVCAVYTGILLNNAMVAYTVSVLTKIIRNNIDIKNKDNSQQIFNILN